jgi:phosphinothricin acetyltransferase
MTRTDADAVLAIYQAGLDTGHASFQHAAPDWATWDREHLPTCRLVLDLQGVRGWAALSAVSGRCVYAGVAEVSVYVHPDARGLGVGRTLLDGLVHASEQAGLWTLQAGIFPENRASLSVHRRAGFQLVGVRRRLGRMEHGEYAGQWRDVALLERRSKVVGAPKG